MSSCSVVLKALSSVRSKSCLKKFVVDKTDSLVGKDEGKSEGISDGSLVGDTEGRAVGLWLDVGDIEGKALRDGIDETVGVFVGISEGVLVGFADVVGDGVCLRMGRASSVDSMVTPKLRRRLVTFSSEELMYSSSKLGKSVTLVVND
jgi:hypothetical protein